MMTLKKTVKLAAFAVVFVAVFSAEARRDEVTLVMVPREEATVKVGLDIADRYPTLLLSYKVGAKGAVSLHGWTGTRWVNVTVEDFKAGNFFQNGPNSALVIEKDGQPVPHSIIPPAAWAPSAFKIQTTQIRPMLHLIGQYYDFKYKDWKWFAKRYRQTIEAINPEGLNVAWYQRTLSENLAKKDGPANADLVYWMIIRMPEPPPMLIEEPVVVEEETIMIEEETVEPLTLEDLEVDVFTNSAPDAVILGAGEADASVATETVVTETVVTETVVEEVQ